jgi:hypothetical protein
MDSICSFRRELLKLLIIIPEVIRPSTITFCTFLNNSFLSRQLSKERKINLSTHQMLTKCTWNSYRFIYTCVVAVRSQYVTHSSLFLKIYTIVPVITNFNVYLPPNLKKWHPKAGNTHTHTYQNSYTSCRIANTTVSCWQLFYTKVFRAYGKHMLVLPETNWPAHPWNFSTWN